MRHKMLLVFWNIYIISDYHTIKELYFVTHGDPNVPATKRWTVLAVGITFLSLVLVALSFFFITYLRGSRFKKQQNDFVNMMTHELKLPMSSIQMFTQTLVEKDVGEEERKKFLECILTDCNRMNLLLTHLLKSQQIERGAFPVHRRNLELTEFLLKFAENWPRDLQNNINSNEEIYAQVDPILLDLALTNLIHNAEKYGKGTIPKLKLHADENWVYISIRDEGKAIPKKYAKKIFRRFFRMPTRETRRQSGVGLGLYIVKTIVKQNRGKITLNSLQKENEIGNEFTMTFPKSR